MMKNTKMTPTTPTIKNNANLMLLDTAIHKSAINENNINSIAQIFNGFLGLPSNISPRNNVFTLIYRICDIGVMIYNDITKNPNNTAMITA